MMKMRAGLVALMAAALVSPVGCGGVGATVDENGVVSEAVTVPTAVANMVPAGVVESTGNLYWTRNTLSGSFPLRWTGRVYRAAKTNVPGQETVLYTENAGGLGSSFGNITFASYAGVWYGYFLANYKASGTYIKRVPLDGSSAAVTFGDAPSLASAGSRLLSDGMYLYYYGANGLYAAPLDGGPTVTVLAISGITDFGFDRAHLYFAVGSQLYWAYKPNYGNLWRLSSTLPAPVTSLFVNPGADNDDTKTSIAIGTTHSVVFWSQSAGHAPSVTTIASNDVYSVSSVTAVGTRVMWTWCSDTVGLCYVSVHDNATQTQNQWTNTLVETGARSLMADSSQMFFVDNYALERLAY